MRRLLPLMLVFLFAAPATALAAEHRFTATQAGEALLELRASAPGTDWDRGGRESAVVTISVDGVYKEDVVLFMGARRFTYKVALGSIEAGNHTVEATFNRHKSPHGAAGARIGRMATRVVAAGDPTYLVHRHAPILYGRDLPEIQGAYENNRTDTPLIEYHTLTRDAQAGTTTIEYTVIWSNEDGGTNTPALMARWGRSTDIEWIYEVTLDESEQVVSETFQAPNHVELPFTGAKEGRHPLLMTSTSNNNLTAVTSPTAATNYRFFLDPSLALPEGRAREVVMDANPWTYEVMAKEMNREDRIEPQANTETREVSNQRNYLYIEFDKDTVPQNTAPGGWIGTALAVKLRGGDHWYLSHHDVADWSVQRDIPAATTVELPAGTRAGDVEAIKALAVPVDRDGAGPGAPPAEWSVSVRAIHRGFMLDRSYRPASSFVEWAGSETLTPARPEAVIWSRTA